MRSWWIGLVMVAAMAMPARAKCVIPGESCIDVVGRDDSAVFVVGVALILIGSVGLGMLMSHGAHRAFKRRRERHEVQLDVAARIARAQLHRSVVVALMTAVALVAVITTVHSPDALLVLLAVPIATLVMQSMRIARLARVLLALRDPSTDAGYDGAHYTFVLRNGERVGWFVTWPATLLGANERGMPRAIVVPTR